MDAKKITEDYHDWHNYNPQNEMFVRFGTKRS